MSEQITGDGFVQNTHEEIAALAAMIMRSGWFSGISEERAHFLACVLNGAARYWIISVH